MFKSRINPIKNYKVYTQYLKDLSEHAKHLTIQEELIKETTNLMKRNSTKVAKKEK